MKVKVGLCSPMLPEQGEISSVFLIEPEIVL